MISSLEAVGRKIKGFVLCFLNSNEDEDLLPLAPVPYSGNPFPRI